MIYNDFMLTYFIKNVQVYFLIQKYLKECKKKKPPKLCLGALDIT